MKMYSNGLNDEELNSVTGGVFEQNGRKYYTPKELKNMIGQSVGIYDSNYVFITDGTVYKFENATVTVKGNNGTDYFAGKTTTALFGENGAL